MEDCMIWSLIVGWIYTITWSVSAYPQIITNWQRKSVVGFSLDFMAFNFTGHQFYCFRNVAIYFFKGVSEAYGEPVEITDVVFSVHSAVFMVVTGLQCIFYERGKQRVHPVVIVHLVLFWGAAVALAVASVYDFRAFTSRFSFEEFAQTGHSPPPGLLDVAGYVKVYVTFFKYAPQAYLNYKRKSTVGWSVGNVILDFVGGMFSLLQMLLDSRCQGSWDDFQNIPKVFLAVETIVFDILFLCQHYVLYTPSRTHLLLDSAAHEDELQPFVSSQLTDFGNESPCVQLADTESTHHGGPSSSNRG
eukprot:Rmarinus@m.30235